MSTPADNGNGSHATRRELADKVDLVRAEQRTEHVKTRAIVIAFGIPSVAKALSVVGLIALPHFL